MLTKPYLREMFVQYGKYELFTELIPAMLLDPSGAWMPY